MFLIIFITLCIILCLIRLNKDYYVLAFFARRVKTSNGMPIEALAPVLTSDTIFGNTFDYIGLDWAQMYTKTRDNAKKMKRSYIVYFLGITVLNIIEADLAEIIFNNDSLITKGFAYDYLRYILGDGLILSTGQKYYKRRKMLTPAFHFQMLEQYEEVFREHSRQLVRELKNINTEVLVLNEFIPQRILKILCETTMGIKISQVSNGNVYYKSLLALEAVLYSRLSNPLMLINFFFKHFAAYKHEKDLKTIHDFASEIIKRRREIFEDQQKQQKLYDQNMENFDEYGIKKQRSAILDTLLLAEQQGLIDHQGICEEVNTFMAAGIDTSSVALTFALLNLSHYWDMQERCFVEIMENIEDIDNLSIGQINSLKYLDCFLKESMRIYYTAPSLMRTAEKETHLPNGLILPKNTAIIIHLHDMAHNPKHFKNPSVFDPDRFTPENSKGRHPLAHAPFSSGQRNCIGQKFAMLEVKTLLINIIRNFKILPITQPNELVFEIGIGLRTNTEIKIKLEARNA